MLLENYGLLPLLHSGFLCCSVGKDCLGDIIIVVWNATPLCLMYTIWSEWNNRAFNGLELAMLYLKSWFLKSLYE